MYTFLLAHLTVIGKEREQMKKREGRSDVVSRCMWLIAEQGFGHSPYTTL